METTAIERIWGLIKPILAQDIASKIPTWITIGVDEIESVIHPKKDAILTSLLTPCQSGYTRASDGSCQPDPLPPDPTHPHD